MSRLKILLADDHMMFAQGLRSFLEDEFELVGTVSAGEELIFAIGQVLAGQEYITPLVATESAHGQSKGIEATQKLRLTPRQREVLQLVIEGCTMKEIATRLGISTRTAESHKYEMMEGLGVETTAELIQYAIKLGLTST